MEKATEQVSGSVAAKGALWPFGVSREEMVCTLWNGREGISKTALHSPPILSSVLNDRLRSLT